MAFYHALLTLQESLEIFHEIQHDNEISPAATMTLLRSYRKYYGVVKADKMMP